MYTNLMFSSLYIKDNCANGDISNTSGECWEYAILTLNNKGKYECEC